jgi:hypothetical protein
VAAMRIILRGKAAGDARVRTAVFALRQNGHPAEVRVTWEPGDAARLTADAVADAGAGKFGCIVAGAVTAQSTRYSSRLTVRVSQSSVLLASFLWAQPTILLTRRACRCRI